MTIVVPITPDPQPPAKRTTTHGNGKTLKEIKAREERSLARIEMQAKAAAALAVAEDAAKISELRAQQKARVTELYVKQEQARAPQFQIDQRPILWLLVTLAAITFVTTAILTADGTIGSAAAARYAEPWMGFVLFGAVEVAILAFMLIYYISGSRLEYDGTRTKSGRWFFAMIVASAVAVGLSVYHVLDLYEFDWLSVEMWVGIGIRLVTAVFFVVLSKGIASVLFAKAVQL